MALNKNKDCIILIILTFLLCLSGIFMIKEASLIWSEYKYNDAYYFVKRQCIYFLIGIIFFIIGAKLNLKFIKKHAFLILIITYVLLVLVLIPHLGIKRNGSSSWLGIREISFQPSEFFKIAIIIFISKYLSGDYSLTGKFKEILPLFFFIGGGLILIMLQPDFGTCMVICISIFSMFFVSKIKFKWFLIIGLGGLSLVSILILSSPYRFLRIKAFLDPFNDPLGSGFQIIQSLFAMGNGGVLGGGISSSIQRYYYLPEPQTDFIFAILIEEFGLIGGSFIIFLYFLLIYYSFKITLKSTSLFKSYLNCGLITLIASQIIINLGVVTSLFPVTGITLPLISYGGSSLIVVLFSLGLIINKGEEYENINC